jgi:hypothetical protein
MTTHLSVLGVSGMCWVVVGYSTQCKPPVFRRLAGFVSGVLGLRTRACMRDVI